MNRVTEKLAIGFTALSFTLSGCYRSFTDNELRVAEQADEVERRYFMLNLKLNNGFIGKKIDQAINNYELEETIEDINQAIELNEKLDEELKLLREELKGLE